MHKNFVWLAFLGLVALATLWYSGIAAYRYYNYSHLEAQTTASSVAWSVNEHSEESFTLTAVYRFVVNGQTYAGNTEYPDEVYRNRWGAQKASDDHASKHWPVWYDSSNPHHSTLQKSFPFKECAYAIILWGILLYCLWLGLYVGKFKT